MVDQPRVQCGVCTAVWPIDYGHPDKMCAVCGADTSQASVLPVGWRDFTDPAVYIDWRTMARVTVVAVNEDTFQLRLRVWKTGETEEIGVSTFIARYAEQP